MCGNMRAELVEVVLTLSDKLMSNEITLLVTVPHKLATAGIM